MIRRHVTLLRLALMASDAVSAIVLFAVVTAFRYTWIDPEAPPWAVVGVGPLQMATAYGAVWVASLWLQGLYRLRTRWSVQTEVQDVLRATAVAALVSLSLLFFFKVENVSRLLVITLLIAQPIVTIATRLTLRAFLRAMRSRGYNTRQMLVVGAGPEAQQLARDVERHTALGLRVMGHLLGPSDTSGPTRHPILGTVDQLEEILHSQVVDEVGVSLSPRDWEYVEPVTRICEEEGRIVRVSMRALGGTLTGGRAELLGETPLVTFLFGPDRVVGLAIKRLVDIAVSSVALVVLSPLIAAIAVWIRLRDGSPVLFGQQRVGLHGRVFTCFKFRTMVPDAEAQLPALQHLSEVRGPAFKMTHDPRITRGGHWLRRTSLDELPQLFNVLRGEMSLVGPRPAPIREVAVYSIWHRRRLSMRPGLTGMWQVQERNASDFDRRATLDLVYIDRWSLWMDLKIMVRTIPALFLQSGR